MDFYEIKERVTKSGSIEIYPDFLGQRTKDLMIRGKAFYAVWDDTTGLWSDDEYELIRLVDEELFALKDKMNAEGKVVQVKTMRSISSGMQRNFRQYLGLVPDSYHQLDESLTFANTRVKKTDYVSRRLTYPLEAGPTEAWNEIIGTLYEEKERAKIEWVIGAIVSGDSKHIQKFLYFYGTSGSGKSTIINIIMSMFDGYYTTFDAQSLTSSNSAFALEAFRQNPLVAIQHDGDLSKVETNAKFNSLIAHEEMEVNEKFKPSYMAKFNAFPIIASNKPVKITDAKSGLIRRLIDVKPSGDHIQGRRYQTLMSQVSFELGAIAQHCLDVYREMGKDYYASYQPTEMMLQTDVFYNFIEDHYDIFRESEGTTLTSAYALYKQWIENTGVEFKLPQHKFREELRNYFHNFEDRATVDNARVRSYYSGFAMDQFKPKEPELDVFPLVLDTTESIFDSEFADAPAQYANASETPTKAWDDISTTLTELSTTRLHYVRVPENHIVIDFDLKGEDGQKSAELNLEAASKFPSTYAEFSKSGSGIHLHYNYAGDVSQLSAIFGEGIEVKVFTGKTALRRKLSKCNNIPVATMTAGYLPLKEKKVITENQIKSEKGLRDLIARNMRKEIHPATKPSIDFIAKILQDAYDSDMTYDLSDLQPKLMAFANNSSNQALASLKVVMRMKFKSKDAEEPESLEENPAGDISAKVDDRIVFYDVEVFPNLFIICWKFEGQDEIVRMINPSKEQVEELVRYKLVGFNNRRYDNHILYARMMGYSLIQLYQLSQKIISGIPNTLFGEAYNLSYADIYDFSSKKQGLKKFEIELGIPHKELGLPWDEPVPEDKWELVAEYCDNDVLATDATFQDRRGDFTARLILADISGLSINESTNNHTARIIFGTNRKPQDQFIYTDLSEMFPGYEYKLGKSTYRGEEVGEGGYVDGKPGFYENVALLDVASMHPNSLINLEAFGPEYTKNFKDLVNARIFIKRGDLESAGKMFGGKLKPYLKDPAQLEALSYALKIAINIVYGMTSAKFPNAFRDPRNKDNIVAKRGALFMIDLKNFVEEQGYISAHIKTDSIKIPNADTNIINLVMEFGQQYGYEFEHEATYEKLALVNDAVYVAKVAPGRKPGYWTATGTEFQRPYVFKKLFSKEKIEFRDLCEAKFTQSGPMYLVFDEPQAEKLSEAKDARYIGKAGLFTPVSNGGAYLLKEKEDKLTYVTGAKGYKWLESDMVKEMGEENDVDMSYFNAMVDSSLDTLRKFGDVEWLLEEA